jgi:hypothetical protein
MARQGGDSRPLPAYTRPEYGCAASGPARCLKVRLQAALKGPVLLPTGPFCV